MQQTAQEAFASWLTSVLLIAIPLVLLGALVLIALAARSRAASHLINCPGCGGGVSPHAANCPHCSRKLA
jgi:hypothetical protein